MRILSILCILSVLFFQSCGNPSKKNGAEKSYTVATLKGPSSMGMIRMIDSIANAGDTDISIKIENEPIQVRKMMLDGSADFAILPTTMAALVYNKGMDYRLIAIPVWGTLYLFGMDTSITSWENLRNKRVYVMARGMTPDVLFRYLLQYYGINPEKDVTLDYSFPTHIDLANAVAAGQATLGVISEPLASMVISRNKSVHSLFDLNREWENIQGSPIALTALLVKADILKENPQKVEQFLLDYEKSSLWVNQQPDSAAALIVKYGILPDHEVALRAIPGSRLNFVRARDIRPQIISYLNVFYTMNPDIIGGKIPDEKFFY